MLLPVIWQNNKRKTLNNVGGSLDSKRQRIKDDESRQHKVADEIMCIVKHNIRSCNEHEYPTPDTDLKIDVDNILNEIPFVRLLSTISSKTTLKSVPIITRVYEERFMRESIRTGEKDCIMGESCECMLIDKKQPFICTQFVIPNITNESQGMCVICLRKTTQLLYYKTIYHGHDVTALIQKHGNICNQIGEYHPSAMLICPPNGPVHTMPIPIVSHQRNRYQVECISGNKHIKQIHVGMQDFQ